jgi:cyclophilin family peptidyl-prolyl cis-trans isomerase/protein-disulfide isomerase
MLRKFLPVLVLGLIFLSACGPRTAETPAPTTQEPTEEVAERAVETEPESEEEAAADDRMPCSTVFEYDINAETAEYQKAADQQPPITQEDWVYGDFDAPITIVEYADFQCPACVGFSLGIKELVNEYPDTIRVVFRHLPLPSIHDLAFISGMAAEAAGAQGKFWEMHDLLYQNQQQWNGYSEEDFMDWAVSQAEALGLDVDQFIEDLTDEDTRSEMEATNQERLAEGLHYTPFVVVNGRVWRDNNPNLYGLIGIYKYGGYEECPPWVIDENNSYLASLDTSAGQIDIELFPDAAPLAVNSFVFLAQSGWYNEVYFHRVLEDFVAQAGDPSGLGVVGPGYTFVNETENGLTFDSKGVLGMANAGLNTNGSQFFITLGPAEALNGGYTIFGEVTEDSLPVLDEIALRDPQTAADFDQASIIYGIEIIED